MMEQYESEAIQHLHANYAASLQRAIKTMRSALDDAERNAARATDPIDACACVMHAMTWGLANASSHIETAMSYAKDMHAVAAAAAEEPKP